MCWLRAFVLVCSVLALRCQAWPAAASEGRPQAVPMLRGASPTTITSIKTYSNTTAGRAQGLVFVQVELADGTVGLGQCGTPWDDLNEAAWQEATFHDAVASVALGMDAANLTQIEQTCWEKYYKNSGEVFFRAIAGFVSATYDALAKREKLSVCNYLRRYHFNDPTPCPDSYPVYGSSLSRTVTPATLAQQLQELHTQHGVGAFKIKIAQRMGHNIDVYPNRSEEVVAAARAALGNQIPLMVDANSGYTSVEYAEPVAAMLRRYNVTWFEEPCVWNDLVCARQVRALDLVPVALGEQEYRLYDDWRAMLNINYTDGRATDIAQPDLGYIGGINRALQVVTWARQAGVSFDPHNPGNTMDVEFTLQLMAALPPNVGQPFMEFGCVDSGIPSGIFRPPLQLQNGRLLLPPANQPPYGWGVSVDLDNGPTRITTF